MEVMVLWFQDIWNIMAPTTWLLLLGLLVSFTFVKKAIS